MAIGGDEGQTTTATVLFKHGVKNINTVADAAQALEPLVHSFPHSGQVANKFLWLYSERRHGSDASDEFVA